MACNISNLARHTCIASIDLKNFYKQHTISMSCYTSLKKICFVLGYIKQITVFFLVDWKSFIRLQPFFNNRIRKLTIQTSLIQ